MAPADACQSASYRCWVPVLIHITWRLFAALDCHANGPSHGLSAALRIQPRCGRVTLRACNGHLLCLLMEPQHELFAESAGPYCHACRISRGGGSHGHVLDRQPASAAKRMSL